MRQFMIHKACCNDGENGDSRPKDCLEKWEQELLQTCDKYAVEIATTVMYREEYINSLNWETKLESWNTIIKKTDEKAVSIVTELEFLLEQSRIVCENSEATTEAVGKLSGLVKSIFDSLYTYNENEEGLKDKIVSFKKLIECLTNVADEDKAEVIKCIETFEQKIALVYEMQDAILSKMIETLKCANLLSAAICSSGGLNDKVEDLLDTFKGNPSEEENCGEAVHYANGGAIELPDESEIASSEYRGSYPCNHRRVQPNPKFPISRSRYYRTIGRDYEIAKERTITLKESWSEKKKISDKTLSQKVSLGEAIKAAEAAESGK